MQLTTLLVNLLSLTFSVTAVPPKEPNAQQAVNLVTITVHGFPSVSPAPTKCDNAWCSNGTSWCEYWAQITGWDPTKGVVPGETPVPVGPCTTAYPDSATTAWVTETVTVTATETETP